MKLTARERLIIRIHPSMFTDARIKWYYYKLKKLLKL